MPFWAKAEAERQERLERLKAEAVEEPKIEPEPVVETQAQQPSGLEFDENFIYNSKPKDLLCLS